MSFEPELGQMLWGNAGWHNIELAGDLTNALLVIGDLLVEHGKASDSPCSNSGARYEGKLFQMRAYCWCDGSANGHENGCPPNFKWRDLEVRWYKHAGRGASQNRDLKKGELATLLRECVGEIFPTAKE